MSPFFNFMLHGPENIADGVLLDFVLHSIIILFISAETPPKTLRILYSIPFIVHGVKHLIIGSYIVSNMPEYFIKLSYRKSHSGKNSTY